MKPIEKLAAIWDAYLANELDDEARRWYGSNSKPTYRKTPPDLIQLYTGRGGKELLTLEDARKAWEEVNGTSATFPRLPKETNSCAMADRPCGYCATDSERPGCPF